MVISSETQRWMVHTVRMEATKNDFTILLSKHIENNLLQTSRSR